MQLRPSAALLARPTLGGLWSQNCLSKNMSYGRMCFSGSYAFQDNMCYDSIYVEKGIYIYIYLFVTVRVLVAVRVASFL